MLEVIRLDSEMVETVEMMQAKGQCSKRDYLHMLQCYFVFTRE